MKSIGKYQVIEELGGSAAGRTYRVRDAFRNREFAAKILQSVPGLSAEAKEQFCGHLAACAELTHHHIAKISDLGEVEEGIFVASEWRAGTDLRRFAKDNPELPLDQRLGVIAQVAEGLAFAHSRGIAHGDLKPGNIFVDAGRDVGILDFGIAKWLQALLAAGSRPEGLVAEYLAPEQVLGQPFDARSDIFALGLILYEFACGKYPFSADPGLIPREIVHSEPEPLRRLDAQVPEELDQLVAHALKKDPEQRMQTAEDFASGLYRVARKLRRTASAAAAANPPSAEQLAIAPLVNQLPPALTSEPVPIPQAAPAAVVEPPALQVAIEEAPAQKTPDAPPVRERPQDAEPEARPWTARSYAAGSPLPPVSCTDLPKPPVVKAPGGPPDFQPPQSFLRPSAPPPVRLPLKKGKFATRALIAALALILAAGIVGSIVSRQNLRGSENRIRVVTAVPEPAEPVAKPSPPPAPAAGEARAPKRAEPAHEETVNPEIPAKQLLNGPVRTLWESGRYGQALALVNQVLASDPSNEDARSWKKKIREAQAAEAALK